MPLVLATTRAFEERADGVCRSHARLVGVFGEGIPGPLVAASGGIAIDVKAPPLADATEGPEVAAIRAVVEDFMDPFANRFLHRFAAGAFDDFDLIFFSRDDVAGLTAYQYAQELRRQGRVSVAGPRLELWNLLHTDSHAAHAFNLLQFENLKDTLEKILGLRPEGERLEAAIAAEARRSAAVNKLPPGGSAAFIARNAGRWLPPTEHERLLQDVRPVELETTIVLVGTACDTPVLHEICEDMGSVVADLQDYGRNPISFASAEPDAIIGDLAKDPLHIRAVPPSRYTQALVAAANSADLVIASVNRNDDAFGWEVPTLRKAVEARGGRFLDLGFRPFRPGAEWRDAARALIAEAAA